MPKEIQAMLESHSIVTASRAILTMGHENSIMCLQGLFRVLLSVTPLKARPESRDTAKDLTFLLF